MSGSSAPAPVSARSGTHVGWILIGEQESEPRQPQLFWPPEGEATRPLAPPHLKAIAVTVVAAPLLINSVA